MKLPKIHSAMEAQAQNGSDTRKSSSDMARFNGHTSVMTVSDEHPHYQAIPYKANDEDYAVQGWNFNGGLELQWLSGGFHVDMVLFPL